MPIRKLKEFLDDHNVKYLTISHSPAFTAQEIAASAHISGHALAKSVVIKANGSYALVVLPADHKINFAKLKEAVHVDVDLATEEEFKDMFPGCEVGAMPPFGNLFAIPVYVSNTLSKQDHIVFNAGSHSELIQMSFHDFERLSKPKLVSI